MRVLLYGGSFDPVHAGHVAMLAHAVLRLRLDRAVVIPARRSPHKQSGPMLDDEWRLAALRRVFAGVPWARVSAVELEREPPSFSWQTVEWALEQWPQAQLFWLLGADQWLELHRWTRFEWLSERVCWVVCGRGQRELERREGVRAVFLPEFEHGASSTRIRELMREGADLPAGWGVRGVEYTVGG